MQFIVTALTGDPCQVVQIRPKNSFYPAIYSQIYGPATHQECVDFVAAHTALCQGVGMGILGRGGVFPWRSAARGVNAADAGRPFPWSVPWDGEEIGGMATEAALCSVGAAGAAVGKQLVMRVEAAEFALQLIHPPTVLVRAWGQVPTLGYTDGEVQVFGTTLPDDGVATAGVFAKPPGGLAAQVISSVPADGNIPFNGNAIQAIHLVGSQGSLLCLPGNNGPFSRQVDGSRLVRDTGDLVAGVECFLIIANRNTYSIGRQLPAGCAAGDRVKFTGVRMDVSFCMEGTPLSLLSAVKV
jgi:hypothetical protein